MMKETNDAEVLTLQEYISRERQLEIEAYETLPGKFDECTYNQGYINQSVLICRSCVKKDGNVAGVCYGCSISCHTKCELVELFVKRSFRCDCGNSRFTSN